MKVKPPIVWVEADRPPARYFINSIKIHQELFPSRRKIVVTNSKFIKKYKKLPVEIVQIEKIKPSVYSTKFDSISKNWTHNKQQLVYWTNTTKRFFYLYDALSHLQIEKSIHLEGDNVLLDASALDSFANNNILKIYYPKQSEGVGCASTLYVGKLKSLSDFLKYINSNWKRNDITDMGLLGEYVEKQGKAVYLESNFNLSTKQEFIFDPVIIGRYFLGNDSRNFRYPTSRRGVIDLTSGSFDPIYCRLINSNKRGVKLENFITGQSLILANIHIHSKRIPNNFLKFKRMMIRESNCPRSKKWKIGKIDYLVLIERFMAKLLKIFSSNRTIEFRLR